MARRAGNETALTMEKMVEEAMQEAFNKRFDVLCTNLASVDRESAKTMFSKSMRLMFEAEKIVDEVVKEEWRKL